MVISAESPLCMLRLLPQNRKSGAPAVYGTATATDRASPSTCQRAMRGYRNFRLSRTIRNFRNRHGTACRQRGKFV